MAKVKDVDRELVDMIRVAESAIDQDIQAKLRELYSTEEDKEKREQVQDAILSEIRSEDRAVLSVAESRIQAESEFRMQVVQGILADDDYTGIWEKLQDPNETNEVTERSKTFRIKRGLLKIHEENQASTYEYWQTMSFPMIMT